MTSIRVGDYLERTTAPYSIHQGEILNIGDIIEVTEVLHQNKVDIWINFKYKNGTTNQPGGNLLSKSRWKKVRIKVSSVKELYDLY